MHYKIHFKSNMYMNQYTISEYRREFKIEKSNSTVIRMCKGGRLPKGHVPKLRGKTYLINVVDNIESDGNLEPYLLAIREYVSVMGIPCNLELTTEIGIKFNVPRQRLLNEILGFKQI